MLAAQPPTHHHRPTPIHHHHHCARTYTVHMVTQAITATYQTDKPITRRQRERLWKYVDCTRNQNAKPYLHHRWAQAIANWKLRQSPPMQGPALASYYDDSGSTASGTHYPLGFAALIYGNQWGRQVTFCRADTHAHCTGPRVTGTLDDHGPYIAGRTFDLNVALRDALGCGDLCTVAYR